MMGTPQEMLHIDHGRPGEPLQFSALPSAGPSQPPGSHVVPMGRHYRQPMPAQHGVFQYLPTAPEPTIYAAADPQTLRQHGRAPAREDHPPVNNWMLLEAQMRVEALQTLVDRELLPKRRDFIVQGQKIAEQRAKVNSSFERAAAAVSRNSDKQARALRELRDEKLSYLEVDAREVATALDDMRHLLSEISLACSGSGAGQDSLPQLNSLEDRVRTLCQKPMKAEIGAGAEDFPAPPPTEYADLLDRHRSLAKLLNVKDKLRLDNLVQMIEMLLQERAELSQKLVMAQLEPSDSGDHTDTVEATLNLNLPGCLSKSVPEGP